MPAGIFREAINDQFRALPDWLLPKRAEKGVVDSDGWFLVASECRIACRAHSLDIDQRVGRVGWAFEIDERDLAAGLTCFGFCAFQNCVYFFARCARRKVEIVDAKTRQYACDQRFGRGV